MPSDVWRFLDQWVERFRREKCRLAGLLAIAEREAKAADAEAERQAGLAKFKTSKDAPRIVADAVAALSGGDRSNHSFAPSRATVGAPIAQKVMPPDQLMAAIEAAWRVQTSPELRNTLLYRFNTLRALAGLEPLAPGSERAS